MDNTLHRISLALLLVMPLLLAVTRAGADIAVSAIGLFFLIHSAIKKDWEWIRRPEIIVLFLLCAYISCNAFFLSDNNMALRALVWSRFVFFFAAVTAWLLVKHDALRKVAKYSSIIIILLMIDTYWQYLTGTSLSGHEIPHKRRLGGPMSHPNIGNLLLKTALPVIGIVTMLLLSYKNHRYWIMFGLAICALIGLIPLTGERSIALLSFLAIGVISICFFRSKPAWRIYILGALSLLGIALVGLYYTQEIVYYRTNLLITNLTNFKDNYYGQLFTSGFGFWQEHPIFGIGPGQYRTLCLTHMEVFSITYCNIHPHNIYLEWMAETGIIGTSLFIAAMALIIQQLLPLLKERETSIPAIFSLATFAVLLWPFIATQSVFSNWPAMLFWYSLSLAFCVPRIASKT